MNRSGLLFVTGNTSKFYEASSVCKEFGIELTQTTADIDEIQHHDPITITKAKAESAFRAMGRPIVVNDSSWSIPAYNGFPGGYMKDVTSWLSTEDFIYLMKNKPDKRIILTETVVYMDEHNTEFFVYKRTGQLIDEPRGKSLPTFTRILVMDGEDMTVSQVFDQGNWEIIEERYKHWYDFARWYRNVYLSNAK